MSLESTYAQLKVPVSLPAARWKSSALWMTSGSFHSRNAVAEPSSSPQVERCTETATGMVCPVAGSTAVVRPFTGPCTVRSIWMVSITGGQVGSGGQVVPALGLASCVSVRSYIGVHTPLKMYAVLLMVAGVPLVLQSFSSRWSMMSEPAEVALHA